MSYTIESLPIGEERGLYCLYKVKDSDLGKQVVNKITVKGEGVSKSASSEPLNVQPLDKDLRIAFRLTSSPAEGGLYGAGETATWDVEITNSGNGTINDVSVKAADGFTVSDGSGYTVDKSSNTANIAEIPLGDTAHVSITHTVKTEELNNRNVKLTVDVYSGSYNTQAISNFLPVAGSIPTAEEFKAFSWSDIASLSDACSSMEDTSLFSHLVGQEVSAEIGTLGTQKVTLVGLNKETATDGSKAGFTFLTVLAEGSYSGDSALATTNDRRYYWNRGIPSYLEEKLFEGTGSELKQHVKEIALKCMDSTITSSSKNEAEIGEHPYHFFLPAYIEIFGLDGTAYTTIPKEGDQFDYFIGHSSTSEEDRMLRCKFSTASPESSGTAVTWLLRSVYYASSDTSTSFYYRAVRGGSLKTSTTGTAYNYNVRSSFPNIAFCFCV